tara:strand:- start:271 stop:7509 length:7239 start_codon:yes stop_codon:yes gene_type:complete
MKNKEGWRFIYQHYSTPDSKAQEGETIGYDQISKENLQLREAIQRRTIELESRNRELEIEGALARIRAQAVAMQQSTDLLDIVVTLRNEFTKLGHEAHYFWHMMWLPETYEKAMTSGDGSKIGFVLKLPRHMHGDIPLLAKWEKSKKPTVVYAMDTDEAIDYVDKMVNLGNFQSIDPQAPTHDDIRHIGGLTFIMARTTHGEIGFSLPGIVENPPKKDLEILVQFAGAFDLAHQRFLDLQKAEKQAREVQIELALEKVRSRTMAMQRSDELQETSFLLDQQVRALGIETWGCAFNIYGENESAEWFGNEKGVLPTYTVPRTGIFKKYFEKGKKGETLIVQEFSGKACVDHYENMSTLPVIGDVLKKLKETNNGFPTYQIDHVVYFKYGYLLFITKEHVPDAYDIFKRFAKVFEQTYTRFLDLQKAEAQAKEAQIETALERVRSSAMAMHKSDDLTKAVDIVFSELKQLEFNTVRCGIGIFNDQSNKVNVWTTSSNNKKETSQLSGDEKLEGHPLLDGIYNAWKKQVDFSYTLKNKDLENYYQVVSNSNLPVSPPNDDNKLTTQYYHVVVFPAGGLFAFSDSEFTQDKKLLMKRFGEVFHLSFTRHLDLKQAEAQAREAQIEMALEKVRSRTMAMQKSEELPDAANVLFTEVQKLGIPAWSCGYNILSEDKKSSTCIMSSEGEIQSPFILPLTKHKSLKPWHKAILNNENFYVYEQGGKDLEEHYNYMQSLPDLKETFQQLKDAEISLPTFQVNHLAKFTNGFLLFITYERVPESHDIFQRFAKVFQQTYTRFLDLEKAEAQAREAQIEMALEKVRSRTMAMQKSEELPEVGGLLYQELSKLGLKKLVSGYVLFDETATMGWNYGVNPIDGSIRLKPVGTNYTKNKVLKRIAASWKKQEPLLVIELNAEETIEHQSFMADESINFPISKEQLLAISPEKLVVHTFNFKQGYLLIVGGELLSDVQQEMITRFAKVFQQTYTRFLDLQKAEKQAREAQIEGALERVRSRSLAMHNSEELLAVIEVVSVQLRLLDLKFDTVSFGKNDQEGDFKFWLTSSGQPKPVLIQVPFFDSKVLKSVIEAQKKEIDFISDVFTKEENRVWSAHMIQHSALKNFPEPVKDFILNSPGFARSSFLMRHIALYIGNYRAMPFTDEENAIFKRFAKVFEQAYTRFLDLQKAEEQTREAQIEAALEKVRSRTMAMQKGEEVKDVGVLLYKELIALGVTNFVSCGYVEINEETQLQSTWVTSPGGDSLGLFYLPLTGDVHFDARYKAWKKQQTVFHQTVAGKERRTHLEYAITTFNSKEAEQMVLTQFPDPTVFYCFNFSHGYLHVVAGSLLTEEEEALLARFTKVFEQTYARFLDLEKAEAQTREAQINLAVERVRAKALAMHKSEEIIEVVAKLKDEVMALDIPDVIAATIFLKEGDDKVRMWDLSTLEKGNNGYEIPFDITFKLKKRDPNLYIKRVWENAENYFLEVQEAKDLKRIIAWLRENNKDSIADEVEEYTESSKLERLHHAVKKLNNGKLVIDLLNTPTDEMETILTKMGGAFDLAYKRFEDLQKAESQTREAQIEASLERVRAASLGMHKSEDHHRIVTVVFKQLEQLGVSAHSAFISEDIEDRNVMHFWVAANGQVYPEQVHIPVIKNPIFSEFYKALDNSIDFITDQLSRKEKNQFFLHYFKKSNHKNVPEERQKFILSAIGLARSTALFKNTALTVLRYEKLDFTKEENSIIKRIGAAFDQSYTRFLDLQKAEAQTREAQIEAALEKVRSRSLAMHKPEELQEVVAVVAEKLKDLGVIFDAGGVILCTYFPDNKDVVHWIAVDDYSTSGRYFVPYFENPIFSEAWDSKNRGDAYFSKEFSVKAKNDFFKQAFENSDYCQMPNDYKQFVLAANTHHLSAAWSKNSAIIIPSLTGTVPSESDAEIMKRFAKVFEQAYIRFMDLQKAEERARETQIDIALERVRSRTLEMQTSEELAETSMVVFQQLVALGIAPNRLFIGIIKDKGATIEAWATNEDGKKIDSRFTLEASKNKSIKKMVTGWKQHKKSLVIDMKGKELQDYFQYLNKEMNIPFIHGLEQKRRVQTLAYFSEGLIGMAAPVEQSENSIRLLERFASVFNLTYTRFKDLKVAEAQAKKAEEDLINLQVAKKSAEKSLSELQQTQKQLIQSEKMASLGELTAGIAHEIQNPLNFVNNFSEVSKELLDEMLEEMENGDIEEVKAIMADVIQNLEKINHHGKRADAIVKGMLQHSRSSSGNKEPTDINALADEYLRLAYHGLRAKDKSFNATLETDFDKRIGKVNIMPQDMGRVILNLITNAFYASNERKQASKDVTFKPTVTVSTKQINESVQISVKDNGNGIPKEIVDKIFQPFFTTKPTGQGTGLGLSMSYDIVTKGHGGELKVETKDGEGTAFTVVLPIK